MPYSVLLPATTFGVTAFAVAALATPAARRLAVRYGFVDQPHGYKRHELPTPLLGGLAVLLAIGLPVLATAAGRERFAGLAAAAVLLALVGLFDDRRGLGAGAKLAVQAPAAVLALLLMPSPEIVVSWQAWLLAWIWLVGMTNAFNLLDNSDGAAVSIAAVAALGFLLLGPSPAVTILASTVLGATLGFLLYNAPPARIFLGDAGSLPLGLTMGVLAVESLRAEALNLASAHPETAVSLTSLTTGSPWRWLAPLMILAVPIADTTVVCISRLRRRKNPLTTPGTDHIAHRLRDRGASAAETLVLLALAGFVANGLAFWLFGL